MGFRSYVKINLNLLYEYNYNVLTIDFVQRHVAFNYF